MPTPQTQKTMVMYLRTTLFITCLFFSIPSFAFAASETLYLNIDLTDGWDNILSTSPPEIEISFTANGGNLNYEFPGSLSYVSSSPQNVSIDLVLGALEGTEGDNAYFHAALEKNGTEIGSAIFSIPKSTGDTMYYYSVSGAIPINARLTPCDELVLRITSLDNIGGVRAIKLAPDLDNRIIFDVGTETTYSPVVTSHPSDQSVFETENASFTILADSCPVSYQWQKNGVDIAEATTASYTTDSLELADNGSLYHCVVSDGSTSVTSNDGTLTVNQQIPPTIISQPQSIVADLGAAVEFSITASGSLLEYQWLKNGTAISGATNSSYTAFVTVSSDNGAEYQCVVSNYRGLVTSSSAVLSLLTHYAHTVDSYFDGVSDVLAIDMDNDGDMDTVGAATYADDITWWENSDGEGTSWSEHTVDPGFDGASAVYATDLDGDSDIDIIGAAQNADEIAWWENSDSLGTTWIKHSIATTFDYATDVTAVDMDGDGDMDIIGAAYYADDIVWWENSDSEGLATTWIEHVVDNDFDGVRSVHAADIDGDGDMDIIGAATNADAIVWWKNSNGLGTIWEKITVDSAFDGAYSAYTVDIDNDGDLDIIGAANISDEIAWWENSTETGASWVRHDIDTGFDGAHSVYAADIDRDGDIDVLGAAYNADDICWWENSGGVGTAWRKRTADATFNGATSVFAADMNGDQKIDILGAGFYEDDIVWWETPVASGDIDGNGVVELVDAIYALQVVVDSVPTGIFVQKHSSIIENQPIGIVEAITILRNLAEE